MLPEAITRLLMKKHSCAYSKAREMFAKDCEKVKKIDKARVRRDLLTTKISDVSCLQMSTLLFMGCFFSDRMNLTNLKKFKQ